MKIEKNNYKDISGENLKIGIVVSTWNSKITNDLYFSAKKKLEHHNVKSKDIYKMEVPGSFELIYGAKKMAENQRLDAIIVFGTSSMIQLLLHM